MQGEIISKMQYIYSKGITSYSFFWGAVILTIIARTLQLPVDKFFKVPIRYHALTYLPSFLLLAFICSVNDDFPLKQSVGFWWFGIPFFLILFYFMAKTANYIEFSFGGKTTHHLSPYSWINFLILGISMLWCGTCCSPKDIHLYEQKTERLISEGKYEDALEVGKNSLTANIRLTNLRMYALSQCSQLPEHLFDYPQYYASEGLICIGDTNSQCYRCDVRNICSHLGIECDSTMSSISDIFDKAYQNYQFASDSLYGIELSKSNNIDSLKKEINKQQAIIGLMKQHTDDYYLCSLLLDRDLNTFKSKINEIYSVGVTDADSVLPVETLPKAYREALVMVYPEIGDTAMIKQYGEYLDMKAELTDSTTSSNQTRRHYGKTFWWYYYNPNITKKKSLP